MRKDLTIHYQKKFDEEHFVEENSSSLKERFQEVEIRDYDTDREQELEAEPEIENPLLFRLQMAWGYFLLGITVALAVLGIITLAVPSLRECFFALIQNFLAETGL